MWSWLAIGLSGVTSVLGARQSSRTQTLVFKVLTLALLCVLVVTQGPKQGYTYWVAAGLMISIVADVLHTLRARKTFYFTGFLVAQLCYSKSFLGATQWRDCLVVACPVAGGQYRCLLFAATSTRFSGLSRGHHGDNVGANGMGGWGSVAAKCFAG